VATIAYRYAEHGLVKVGNLHSLIASSSYSAGSRGRFTGWTRWPKVRSAGRGEFTVQWYAADNSVGMYSVNVIYRYVHGKLTRPHRAYRPDFRYDGDAYWSGNTGTVYQHRMPLFRSPGSSHRTFYAHAGGHLTVTKVLPRGHTRYFQVRNAAGHRGWFNDADYSMACDPDYQDCNGIPGPAFEDAVIGG
jgi:hypothetical protein